MSEKALATTNLMDTVHHGGDVAVVRTVHEDLDVVMSADGRLIIGVSQQPGRKPRTLDLKRVVGDATDIVEQPGVAARDAYGQVYVVTGRPNQQGEQELQRMLIDYPGKKIITNPGEPTQHEYPADGLPQSFTAGQVFQFVPSGGDPSRPKTSSGAVLAAYMYAPPEGAAVPNLNPAAIATGNLATLTYAYLDPARPLTAQGLREAPIVPTDPIAASINAAAQRVVSESGSGTLPLYTNSPMHRQ